jgi:phosphatidylserine/phosphatidylglycerophosphate/cardiolipin synthase-like enzyme
MAVCCGLVLWLATAGCVSPSGRRQQSLDEWRSLTETASARPRVFVRGDNVRFFFDTEKGVEVFAGDWQRLRVPSGNYRVNTATLRWEQRLSQASTPGQDWREALVISGAEWHQISATLTERLTPSLPGRGLLYEAFLADRLLYRDAEGVARSAPAGETPESILVERRFSLEETLAILADEMERHLTRSHSDRSLFLVLAPNGRRFTQPLLLDRQQKQCVFLTPAALYDVTDRGTRLTYTATGLRAFGPESHGLALLKNPVSSAARLGDLAAMTAVRFLRAPLPRSHPDLPPLAAGPGMDLEQWEQWLDRNTGTRLESGSMSLLIGGDQFFERLDQGLKSATNHIHMNMYIFDRDDVAVDLADLMRRKSQSVPVKVILDRMGCTAAAFNPPATPLPEDFVPPKSISRYLAQESRVQVRIGYNPWFSADHSKVILVDGATAWLGGMNIGREYRYEWHDLMVELDGPVVRSLEREFQRQWAHTGPGGDLAYLAAWLQQAGGEQPPAAQDGKSALRLLPTKVGWKPYATAVLGALRRARSYVYVENSYLFDKRIVRELVRARRRGVDVRVVLPCVNDLAAAGRSNLVVANYLIDHGVRVYFYPGMTHVKAFLVDGWACVGSSNLNHLGLRVNHEQNVATSDPVFAGQLRRDLFEQDFARAYELTEPLSVGWFDLLSDIVLESF